MRGPDVNGMLGLLSANSVLAALKNFTVAIEPVIGPLVGLGQFAVACVTVLWIYRRATGAKISNDAAQRKRGRRRQ